MDTFLRPIEDLLQECRRSLESCTENAELSSADWAQTQLINFNLWAAGLGAFATKHNALRVRLRECDEILLALTLAVDILNSAVAQCYFLGTYDWFRFAKICLLIHVQLVCHPNQEMILTSVPTVRNVSLCTHSFYGVDVI